MTETNHAAVLKKALAALDTVWRGLSCDSIDTREDGVCSLQEASVALAKLGAETEELLLVVSEVADAEEEFQRARESYEDALDNVVTALKRMEGGIEKEEAKTN
jgi:hypothetical protein